MQFTDQQVSDTLKAVVAEQPEYVYAKPAELKSPGNDRCLYVHGDKPGCGVGHVLHRLGVPLSFLAEYEGVGASILAVRLDLPWRASVLLEHFQHAQDDGRPWVEALATAEQRTGASRDV